METILLTFLLLSVLYLIFAQRHTESDVSNILHRIDFLNKTCQEQEKRINELERNIATVKTNIKRRKSTNRYRRLFEITISKYVVYCNNGWSVSKTLLTKAQSKAYRVFERGIRPSYIRAKQKVHSLVYRAKERQEVLSFKRTKAIHTERFR